MFFDTPSFYYFLCLRLRVHVSFVTSPSFLLFTLSPFFGGSLPSQEFFALLKTLARQVALCVVSRQSASLLHFVSQPA
jgi:hypothetical protein